jgi:hypothetical protein
MIVRKTAGCSFEDEGNKFGEVEGGYNSLI